MKKSLEAWEVYKGIYNKLGISINVGQIFGSNSMLKSMVSSLGEKKPHYMEKIRLKAFGMMFKKK